MKIRPVGAELFMQAGRRADGHKATTAACLNFANGPKNS